ncbi:MAG: thiol reductant ABC exporter subunit CydD [Actinomycetaceae bacterium]|nr:thiol reductant ABC exporter subunit CydD [Actinomycetaceae bacterium]
MKPLDRRLLAYARPARRYIIFLSATGLALTVLALVQSLGIAAVLSPLVDGSRPLGGVLPALGVVCAAFALRALVIYAQEAIGHRAALRTIADLRTQVLRKAGDRGERWLSGGRTSSTVTLVTEALDDLESYFVKFLPQLILTSMATPLIVFVILLLDWISAVAIVVCIPLIPIFMILVGKMTQSYADERLAAMQRLGDLLLDLLAGLATLKALGREKSPKKRVRQLGDDYASKTMQTLYVAFLSGSVLEFLATLSTALVAVEVGLRLANGDIGLFVGLAIIMLTPEAFKPLREVGSQFHASANGVAAAEAVFDVLEGEGQDAGTDPSQGAREAEGQGTEADANDPSGAPDAARAAAPTPSATGAAPTPDLRSASIQLSGVSVRAPGRATIAPFDLTMRVEPGRVTVLRGRSGAGKSTTASVILGLVEPTAGSVTVGGIPMSDIDRTGLWRQITWVPQRPAIIPGTVAENIGAEPGPALDRAAALTGFDEVVAGMPNGWDSMLGHGGVGLSVGQRQRLALTRALVQARPFVLLDEPSAHLDAMSERYVSQAVQTLREGGHTVLVIAHRSALFEQADTIIDVRPATAEVSA